MPHLVHSASRVPGKTLEPDSVMNGKALEARSGPKTAGQIKLPFFYGWLLVGGCSGGGKSTLLAELGRRGHAGVEEPGRRIVKEELKGDGSALPWVDEAAFARRAIVMALADRASATVMEGWVFFDSGLIDAAAGLQHLTGEQVLGALGAVR